MTANPASHHRAQEPATQCQTHETTITKTDIVHSDGCEWGDICVLVEGGDVGVQRKKETWRRRAICNGYETRLPKKLGWMPPEFKSVTDSTRKKGRELSGSALRLSPAAADRRPLTEGWGNGVDFHLNMGPSHCVYVRDLASVRIPALPRNSPGAHCYSGERFRSRIV